MRRGRLTSRRTTAVWAGLVGFLALVLSLTPGCTTRSPSPASPSPPPSPASSTTTPQAGSAGGFSLASQRVEPRFPQSISFQLKARSSSPITKVELEYTVEQISPAEVIVVVFPDFVPGKEIETTWTWDMRKASLPPGAEVSYHWKLWDSAGNSLTTEFASFRFNDERYKWNRLEKGELSLKWYRGDEAFAQRLMSSAQATLQRLEKDTGAVLKRPAQVWIYASAADLRGAMIFPQEWTGGVAFVRFGIVALGVPPEMLAWGQRALAHELTHLVIYQMTFNPYNSLPTWLDEGLAMHSEGELRSDLKSALERAISQDKLFSVRSLCSVFPAATEEARLCYAESYSLVEFLLQKFGRDKMLKLLLTFKEGTTYDEALLKVYGFDLDGLDRLWRESLSGLPRAGAGSHLADLSKTADLVPSLVGLQGF